MSALAKDKMRRFFFKVAFLIVLSVAVSGCSKKEKPPVIDPKEIEMQQKISEIMENLSIEEKIAQMFLVNIAGDADFKPVERLVPGGCLFFSYNIAKTPEKLKEFTDSIKNYCLENGILPPYIAVDQEGGYVNRLREITSPLPSQKRVANENTVEEAYKLYKKQGEEMKALGFHLNLAPVCEVSTETNKSFLDTRTFGNLENTIEYSRACVSGYEESGVGAVLKHFPGNSSTDPHIGLPLITATKEEFEKNYIAPFRSLVADGVSAVLMSHAKVKILATLGSTGSPTAASEVAENLKVADNGDAEALEVTEGDLTPACLSRYWVGEVLRKQLGFKGLVISDDIFMGALADNGFPPEIAVVEAVKAGVNILMISEKRFVKEAELLLKLSEGDEELQANIDESVRKIIRFKIEKNVILNEVETSF